MPRKQKHDGYAADIDHAGFAADFMDLIAPEGDQAISFAKHGESTRGSKGRNW
jgi:hypothetical protein